MRVPLTVRTHICPKLSRPGGRMTSGELGAQEMPTPAGNGMLAGLYWYPYLTLKRDR